MNNKMAEGESAAKLCNSSSKTRSNAFFPKELFSDLASSLANASTCRKRHLSALSSLQTVLFDTSFSILFQGFFLHETPILSIKSENMKKISNFPPFTSIAIKHQRYRCGTLSIMNPAHVMVPFYYNVVPLVRPNIVA